MTTKEQERKALAKIKAIVEGLGENSYIGTALAGCFEKAEENIEYDAAFSLQDELQTAEKENALIKSQLENAKLEIDKLNRENRELNEQVNKLAEWEPDTKIGTQFSQARYFDLRNTSGTRVLSDDEAARLIEDEFGFRADRVNIIHHAETYKKSDRLHIFKVDKQLERDPLYNASDWNYIRFDCNGWYYEMINGQIQQYYC